MHKLADIVTSLWLGISKLDKELFNVTYVLWKPFNNIIIEINELYVYKYLLDLDLNSDEYLEGQLVPEERIQSTATDKISTVTFQNLTVTSSN